MAFSPLGFSVPDLTITGSAGAHAAWGGKLGVAATVINTGSSTITNPIAQAPGSLSTADAPTSTVAVVITPRRSMKNAVTVNTFQAPPVGQNSLEQIEQSFTLPVRPPGFKNAHGHFFVHLIINSDSADLESNRANNISAPIRVRLTPGPAPQVVATGLAVPPVMQPGDTIQPSIAVTNVGNAPTTATVQVALVASTTPYFTIGSSIVALYDITTSIPSAAQVPTGGLISTFSQTANLLNNSVGFTGLPITLPTAPRKYYLGLVVDPYGVLQQTGAHKARLQQVQVVGPPIANLPPAGVLTTANPYPFPLPPSGNPIGVTPLTTTTSALIDPRPPGRAPPLRERGPAAV